MKRFPIAIVLTIAVCAVTVTIRAAQDNSNRAHAQHRRDVRAVVVRQTSFTTEGLS